MSGGTQRLPHTPSWRQRDNITFTFTLNDPIIQRYIIWSEDGVVKWTTNTLKKHRNASLCAIRDVGTSHFQYIKFNRSTVHIYLLVNVRFEFSLCAKCHSSGTIQNTPSLPSPTRVDTVFQSCTRYGCIQHYCRCSVAATCQLGKLPFGRFEFLVNDYWRVKFVSFRTSESVDTGALSESTSHCT